MRGKVVFADIADTATHYGCDEIGNSTNRTVNSANQYVPIDCDEDDNLFFDGVFDFTMPRREFVKWRCSEPIRTSEPGEVVGAKAANLEREVVPGRQRGRRQFIHGRVIHVR